MKSLKCVVIGDGSGFVVSIDEINLVGHLKNIIKEKKMYDFPADQLTLYVAKKDGKWLKSDGQWLENWETPLGIAALMNDSSKMNPTFCMGNTAFGFPDKENAGEDEIHVLVDVPQYVKTYYRTIRKHRKKAVCYIVASFLLLAGAICYLSISRECSTTQEGRLE